MPGTVYPVSNSTWSVRYNADVASGTVERSQDLSTWLRINDGEGLVGAYLLGSEVYVSRNDGIYFKSLVVDGTWVAITASEYNTAASGAVFLGGVAATPAPAPAPSGPMHVIATDVDVTGHQIHNLAAGVAPTDGVNVSQLSALNLSLTTAIEAGDLANANAVAAANVRIDNLPAGLTMAQVTAEAQRLVGIAVADEIIDDAQKQLLVDAVLTALQDVDVSILTDVDALEVALASLLPRVLALEAAKVAQDAINTAQTATNSAQGATNASVQNALDANVAAIGVEAATNAAQNTILTSHANQISAINLRLDPIVYKVRGGVCSEAVNAMASQCVRTGIAGPDASYSVSLPADRAHSVGVVYLMMSGKRVQVACGSTVDAAGLVNQFTFLNVDADIVFS